MALHDTWSIRSRARQCAATEQAFAFGETIITALFPDPDSSGYLRKDFTEEAWDARTEDDELPFSFWRSVYEPPVQEEKPDPMKKEDPESLLRRLVDEDEEHTENVRYILAVMLERQKLLRETDAQTIPSGVLRVYEHRKTGEAFLVRDPNIPLSDVETVQEEVILLLENDGRMPEPETESPESTEEEPTAPESPVDPDEAVNSSDDPAEEVVGEGQDEEAKGEVRDQAADSEPKPGADPAR